jgi:hypothetical protein
MENWQQNYIIANIYWAFSSKRGISYFVSFVSGFYIFFLLLSLLRLVREISVVVGMPAGVPHIFLILTYIRAILRLKIDQNCFTTKFSSFSKFFHLTNVRKIHFCVFQVLKNFKTSKKKLQSRSLRKEFTCIGWACKFFISVSILKFFQAKVKKSTS